WAFSFSPEPGASGGERYSSRIFLERRTRRVPLPGHVAVYGRTLMTKTRMERAPNRSSTRTVTRKLPASLGRPANVPVFVLKWIPGGSLPLVAQRNGRMPPRVFRDTR